MRLLFFFTIILTGQRLQAQKLDFSIKWGQEFSAPRKSSLNDIVGHDGTGIYVIKERFRGVITGGTSYTLEHYNNNFTPTKSYDLEIKEDGRYGQIQHLLHLKNKLYIFYSLTNLKERRNFLYVREVNKATLVPESGKRKIGEIDFSGKSKYNSGNFNFRVSRDSSKLAVIYGLPFNEDEGEAFGFNVLDDDLNSIWEKQTTLPYRDDLFTVESFKVDINGNVYLLGLLYKEKRRSKRKGKPNYNYEVFAWSDKGDEMKQYSIALEDRFLTDMQIEVIDNRNLVCAGFYSEKGTFSVRGTYFLTVDLLSKEIKAKSFKEFGLDFIVQNMSEREANRTLRREERGDEAELYEYDLDKLLVGKDGSAILIGEQYYMKEVTSTIYINGRPNIITSYHFYYNDIIAVKISATGQIEWAEKISKTQHTVDDNGFYSSYTLAILKGKICFFFNDHPENVNYQGIGRPRPYNARESLVMLVSLNQKGEQARQPVFGSRDVEVITRPKVCEQISNYEVILFGQRRKTQQFAKVMVN